MSPPRPRRQRRTRSPRTHIPVPDAAADAPGRPRYVLHPYSWTRQSWDLVSVALITYNTIMIPFSIAFGLELRSLEALELAVDVFFMLDLVLNFRTGVEVDGAITYDQRTIFRTYLRGWFTVDFLSAFQWQLVLLQVPSMSLSTRTVELFRLMRLVRLFRLFRMIRIVNRLEYALLVRASVSSISKFAFLVVVSSHWLTCLFYSMASLDDSGSNWVASLGLEDAATADQYLAGYYWAIMTMTTVGFGDVSAGTTPERLLAIVAMIYGAGLFAYGVTNVVDLVASLNASENEFRAHMDNINAYMRVRELPYELRGEIREFFHHANHAKVNRGDLQHEDSILAQLPEQLRAKVAVAVNEDILQSMPFFHGVDPLFTLDLAQRLETVFLSENEEVITEGQFGHEMYFICGGEVAVSRGAHQVGLLAAPLYFGESCILHDSVPNSTTVRTAAFCELRRLRRAAFRAALRKFPRVADDITMLQRTHHKALRTMGNDDLHGASLLTAVAQGPSLATASLKRTMDSAGRRFRTRMAALTRDTSDFASTRAPEVIHVRRRPSTSGGRVAPVSETAAAGPSAPAPPPDPVQLERLIKRLEQLLVALPALQSPSQSASVSMEPSRDSLSLGSHHSLDARH